MASRDPGVPTSGRPPGSNPPEVYAVDQPFDADRLYSLRATLGAHASGLGVPPELVDRLLIVASELATNAVRHGGGKGRLRLWRADAGLYCEVSDSGPGFADPAVGDRPPGASATGGRGMWICKQLCDEVVVSNGTHGATVTAFLGIAANGHRNDHDHPPCLGSGSPT